MAGEDEVVLQIKANAQNAIKELASLGRATVDALEKGPKGVKDQELAISQFEAALQKHGETWRALGVDVDAVAKNLEAARAKQAENIKISEEANASIVAQRAELKRLATAATEPSNEIERLGRTITTAMAKGPRSVKEVQVALDQLDVELTENAERWKVAGVNVDAYRQKLAAWKTQQATNIQQLDQANKALAAQKVGLDDLGRAAGLPIGELGQLAAAGAIAVGAVSDLKNLAGQLVEKMAGTSEEGKVLKESLNALLDPSHFLLHAWNALVATFEQGGTALDKASDKLVELFTDLDKAPSVAAKASEGAIKVYNSVKKVIEAREEHKAKIKEEVDALEAVIRTEERQNGVSEETRQEAEALVKKYGDELPKSFLTTVQAIGKSTEALNAERDALIDLGRQGMADIAAYQKTLDERFTTTTAQLEEQTGALLESAGALKLQGNVTKEESDKVVKAVLDQIEVYRTAGQEVPEALQEMAAEWVDLSKQTKDGGKLTIEQVDEMVASYKEAGEKVPVWLQKIIDHLHEAAGAQKEVSAGAKEFADSIRIPQEQLAQTTQDIVDGYELLRSEGKITASEARMALERVIAQMNEYVHVGKEAPPVLLQIATALGRIISEQDALIARNQEIEDGYQRQLELAGSAADQLDRAAAAAGDIVDAFEGLPDDGTGLPGTVPADRPPGQSAALQERGRQDGQDYAAGFDEGVTGGGSSGTPGAGGTPGLSPAEQRIKAFYEAKRNHRGPYNPGEGVGGPFNPGEIPDYTRPVTQRARQDTHGGMSAVPLAPYGIDTALSPNGMFAGILHLIASPNGLGEQALSEAIASAEGFYYAGPVVVTGFSFGTSSGPLPARLYENATGYVVGEMFYAKDLGTSSDANSASALGPGFGASAATLPGARFSPPGGGIAFAGGAISNKQVQVDDARFSGGVSPGDAAIIGLLRDIGQSLRGDGGALSRVPGGQF